MGSMRLFDALFGEEMFPRNLRAVEELKALAAEHGRSLPQLALRWVIASPVVSTALVGCRNVTEVEDNVGAVGWDLSADELAAIEDILQSGNGAQRQCLVYEANHDYAEVMREIVSATNP
jgi:aryl-alcohol dehydrogenase-like predicted oxidoreductase